jgi:hypothetical protein
MPFVIIKSEIGYIARRERDVPNALVFGRCRTREQAAQRADQMRRSGRNYPYEIDDTVLATLAAQPHQHTLPYIGG